MTNQYAAAEKALRAIDPEIRLFTAISILQNYIAGQDTVLNREMVFGRNDMPVPSLEFCERILGSLAHDIPSSSTKEATT